MSTNAPARPAGAAGPQGAQRRDESPFAKIWPLVQACVVMYMASQFVKSYTAPKVATNVKPSDGAGSPAQPVQPTLMPVWPTGTMLDMYVLLSTSLQDPFGSPGVETLPRVEWKDIKYGDWKEDRVEEFTVDVPVTVQHNASLYAHIYLSKDQASPNPLSKDHRPWDIVHYPKLLTRYMKKPKTYAQKKLLGGNDDGEAPLAPASPELEQDEWLPYWHRNLTINIVSDPSPIPVNKMWPPVMAKYMQLSRTTPNSYYPVIFPNDFWLLRGHMNPINTTTPTLPLRINFYPVSTLKFQLFTSMGHGFDEAANKGQGAELDEVKRVFIETNPWLLIVTAAVTLLHMLFETLAFSSDIAHWRTKKEFTGVSVRTILLNVFVQVITGLYLWDNSEETSYMILVQQLIAVAIEAWKITKAVDIVVTAAPAGSLLPVRVEFKDKHVLNETEKKTQEYDALAFRYVSYVAIPTLAAYTVYSLIYESHKGWYSFIITTLSSFVYMFGFVQLVPQLIINYKLKSVAHLPWKTMAYKTLSTVVDDFFAFIIKMPFLHRLASFRDDVVFLILLYQRWIYRVDYSRANEYGQVGEDDKAKPKLVEGTDKKE